MNDERPSADKEQPLTADFDMGLRPATMNAEPPVGGLEIMMGMRCIPKDSQENVARRFVVVLILILLLLFPSDAVSDESDKPSNLWLRNTYLKFNCEDSSAARYVVLHNNSPIYRENGYCLMSCSQRISLSDRKMEYAGSDSIVIYEVYRSKITIDKAQIDFSRAPDDGLRNHMAINPDLAKQREKREQIQAIVGFAGAILLFAGIIYVVNNAEVNLWKMPDP